MANLKEFGRLGRVACSCFRGASCPAGRAQAANPASGRTSSGSSARTTTRTSGATATSSARTPTIDSLAKDGVLYENCFPTAPVCAPSRFSLITGVFATSLRAGIAHAGVGEDDAGDAGVSGVPARGGYYCTNNAKTDYNAPIDMKDTWDASGKNAHWRNRPAGKPFFAVFNHEVTHESCLFGKFEPLPNRTKPADVRLPAYCPDTPETRGGSGAYYDQHRRAGPQVGAAAPAAQGRRLQDEDTIVFTTAITAACCREASGSRTTAGCTSR